MTKLKTLAAVAATTLAIGGAAVTTANAQPWRPAYADNRLTTSYVDGLNWKITNAARNGAISWGEARDLRAQVRSVQPLAWRVQTGRASPWEVRRLENVVDRVDSLTSGYAYNAPRYRHW
ncbi:hypothetical protein [Phenylobacterium soli]|uniref:DUF4148 domain-containing protein n=1 Tax=Phenylobacterium soli TaxID=2170551 RepID=A0A328AH10_9CAUL|nr:hypothetical protein [Phenylobacterium soli]RAK53785.1 hypothetical protein DJ017_04205 [Phenylobacterium soli]